MSSTSTEEQGSRTPKLDKAKDLISEVLSDGEWVPSKEVHRKLASELSDGMFGRAKTALGVEHRQARGSNGRMRFEWRLRRKTASSPV